MTRRRHLDRPGPWCADCRGEDPIERRVGPGDFLAMIYRHPEIDYERVAIPNFAGRPIPIVSQRRAIADRAAAAAKP